MMKGFSILWIALLIVGTSFVAVDAQEPVGAPADQCWKFELKNGQIKGDSNQVPVAERDDTSCVYLQSAALEDGSATYVVCCKKDEHGKCKDCTTGVTLRVVKPGRDQNVDEVASKKVKISCKPGED